MVKGKRHFLVDILSIFKDSLINFANDYISISIYPCLRQFFCLTNQSNILKFRFLFRFLFQFDRITAKREQISVYISWCQRVFVIYNCCNVYTSTSRWHLCWMYGSTSDFSNPYIVFSRTRNSLVFLFTVCYDCFYGCLCGLKRSVSFFFSLTLAF